MLLTTPPPNLSISKTGTVAVPGREIDYFILLENTGSVTVNDVDVFELFSPPDFFTLLSTDPPHIFADESIALISLSVTILFFFIFSRRMMSGSWSL